MELLAERDLALQLRVGATEVFPAPTLLANFVYLLISTFNVGGSGWPQRLIGGMM